MAKKKNNNMLYAGIAAAALLLFKKKDAGMSGVGALRPKHDLVYILKVEGNGKNAIKGVFADLDRAIEEVYELVKFDKIVSYGPKKNLTFTGVVTGDSSKLDSYTVAWGALYDGQGNFVKEYFIQRRYLIK